MTVIVYYSEISAHKEVKKRQQKVMMILESKSIPYEAIDITEAGRETDKDFMLSNAKSKDPEVKHVLSPQIFNGETYCGDYEDFELANENDELEKFLNVEKVVNNNFPNGNRNGTANGTSSREGSAEAEAAKKAEEVVEPVPQTEENPVQESESHPQFNEEEDPMSTSESVPQSQPPAPSAEDQEDEGLEDVKPDPEIDEEEEEAEEN